MVSVIAEPFNLILPEVKIMSLNACVAKPEIKTPLDADILYLILGTAEPFNFKPPELKIL